ncbi:L-cystine transport system permease protein [Kocuria rhizophila]|uniref:L-cystine transport system permease protein YecS n=3 Tax=Kocuria TaxID=57493 RepID=A0A7D7KY79_KOCVA|nr:MULTISPECIES: amino acid ABC transporter permease [Actinomycetes]ASE11507.1 amino acid ABC transporter permease [Kocuria rhizophila]MBK4119806.1 amino acid ABC transporter permease [Kocuria rhizophila]MBS6031317.1 amino acid ABC transporter permease [Kocuria rhizophila]MCC5671491.1 amino acid ABC transporter permease [Kocuria rhizophila]MDN5632305.1 amino acid ABC transporter permease [Kocuria sp.]
MTDFLSLWADSLPQLLLATVKVTIPLSIIAFVLALVVAVLATAMRLSGIRPLQWISRFYVWLFRGTPILVQLFIIFYGLPAAGITLSAWTSAILAFTLNTGAYAAETLRASVQSIPRGQLEAARTLNYTGWQTVRHVVAPQALRIALPPLGNDLIDLVKGTSLVMVITLADVFQVGRQIAATNFQPLALYAEVAVIYLAIFTVLSLLQSRLERVSNRYIRSSHA